MNLTAGPRASPQVMEDLCRKVRKTKTLLEAWHAIRRNAETSQTARTKQLARDFGANLPANLRKISDRLRTGYDFAKPLGALPAKGPGKKGKRPIVVAPLEDRIVQRAILDVLQGATELAGVQQVLGTRTSIGGIPGRGTDHGIALIQGRVEAGDRFVAGSDISGFFTKISRPKVIEFLQADGVEGDFLLLIEKAMTVELENAATMAPEDLKLFPTGEDGVAQGCPLSALASNIALAGFDATMNGRGITCIRYIDDFILVGKTRGAVASAMKSAKAHLSSLGMNIYDPAERPDKAFIGDIGEGHDFLGYHLIPGIYPPSKGAQDRLLNQVRSLVKEGKKNIARAARGEKLRSYERCYAQTLVMIDQTIKGWRGSFQSSNCPEVFEELDRKIDRDLHDFRRFYNEKVADVPNAERRRLMRVQRLVD